ncbi:MAG: TetR/AcrR family transcriptional regulator, partial [Chloroflexota bacterium]
EQEILRTAARMIRDNGYVNLNMDDLAEEVGISKPTLYQHFKGKDDMVAKAMHRSMERMEEFIDELPDTPAIDQIEYVMRYLLRQQTDPDGFSVAIMQDGSQGLKHLKHPPMDMQDIRSRVGQKITALIQRAKNEGGIRQDMSNLVVMGIMFSSMSVAQSPAIMGDYSQAADEIIESTIAFVRRGLAPTPKPQPASE